MNDHMTRVPLGRVCDINPESLPDSTDRDFRFHYVDLSCVQTGRIGLPKEQITFGDSSPRARRKIQEGDVLLSTVRPNLQGFAIVEREHSSAIVSTGFAVLRAKPKTDTRYIYQVLLSDHVMKQMTDNVAGSNYPAITASIVSSLIIPLPSLPEQKAIVTVLSTWDRGIRQLTDLIAAKLRFKQGLMQQLLSGQRRFKAFAGDWNRTRIGEIATEVSERNGHDSEITVLSCTKYDGLVSSLEYFGKRVFSENTENYKVVRRNEFAYATNHIEEGSIGLLTEHEAGLVSPMYTVFRLTGEVLPAFLYRLLKTETYRQMFQSFTSASVNRRGSLRWKQFATIPLLLPNTQEQERITTALIVFDREINLLRKQLDSLKQQKKGMMQKLLTGEVRVKLPKGVV